MPHPVKTESPHETALPGPGRRLAAADATETLPGDVVERFRHHQRSRFSPKKPGVRPSAAAEKIRTDDLLPDGTHK